MTKTADDSGQELAMKPTRFLTSSQPMAEGLGRRCDRSHKHQHLVGGRAGEAAFYPIPLIRAILKGMRATTDWEAHRQSTRNGQTELIHGFSFNQGPFRSAAVHPCQCQPRRSRGPMEAKSRLSFRIGTSSLATLKNTPVRC